MEREELEPGRVERALPLAHLLQECLRRFATVPIPYETSLLTVLN